MAIAINIAIAAPTAIPTVSTEFILPLGGVMREPKYETVAKPRELCESRVSCEMRNRHLQSSQQALPPPQFLPSSDWLAGIYVFPELSVADDEGAVDQDIAKTF